MGYMKHKYTRAYYLKEDSNQKKTVFGAEGVEEFRNGNIRKHDLDILRHINFSDKNVLDIGFGRGEAIKYALDNGACKVVGVDFSEDVNAIAREHLHSYGLEAELHCMDALYFLEGYGQQNNNKFDIVIMLDVIEHVPRDELTQILSGLIKWLSSLAVLVVNTPVYQVDNDIITDGLNPLAKDTSDGFEETYGMHCNRYTKVSLREYFKEFGLTCISNHIYANNLTVLHFMEGTLWSRFLALIHCYPIKKSILYMIEHFEYAMSWDEINKINGNIKEEIFWTIRRNPRSLGILFIRLSKRALNGYFNRLYRKIRQIPRYLCNSNTDDIPSKTYSTKWVTIQNGPLLGHSMFLDPASHACWQMEMIEGTYDSFIYKLLDKLLNLEGATLWDVGAHIGYHSLAFAAKVGSIGNVVGFEPNPHNMARLKLNIEKNSNLKDRITLMDCALGRNNSEELFIFSPFVDDGRSSGSHLSQAYTPEEANVYQLFKKQPIKVLTIDSLLADNLLPVPKVIKIDVEGSEADVLEGAQKTLCEHKPILLIEVHHIAAMHDSLNILLRCGYQTNIIQNAPFSPSRCFLIAKAVNELSI